MATFTQAYLDAGYKLTNPRNQWSARTPDGSRVALTVWADEIDKSAEPWVCDTHDHPRFKEWAGRVGNAIRKKDIAYALEALDGRCDLILCVAEDPLASIRKVKIARHWTQRVGRLVAERFDHETGHFRLELHPASDG